MNKKTKKIPQKKIFGLLTPKQLVIALCLILFFGGAATAFTYIGLQQPPRTFHIPLPGQGDADAVLRNIGYKNIQAMLDKGRAELSFVDSADGTPVLTLQVKNPKDWQSRSDSAQKGMCLYIQSIIPQAQYLPSGFIPGGQQNPEYSRIAANVQTNLCRSCWGVSVEGRYVVAGDRAWKGLRDKAGVETWLDMRTRIGGD